MAIINTNIAYNVTSQIIDTVVRSGLSDDGRRRERPNRDSRFSPTYTEW